MKRPPVLDVGIALAFAALGVADTLLRLSPPSGTAPARTALVPVLVVTAALALRRTAPLLTVVAIVTAVVAPALAGHVRLVYWGEFIPWLLALYSVGRHDTRRHAVAGALVSVVGFAGLCLRYPDLREPGNALYDLALMVLATAVGAGVRQRATLRHENVRLDEERRRATERATERATAAERSRIARELHDVISHGISVIVLQAGGARLGFERDPEGAREALRRIELAGRESLTELRVMLEVLRADELVDSDGIGPLPTLQRLEDLVEEHRRLGLQVRLQVPDDVADVPLPVQLSAYRIVQEGLTNVRKHAGSAPTRVALHLSETLGIEVCNGPDPSPRTPSRPLPSAGVGLVGLGERVTVLGGRLQAGETSDGGFRLHAEIPLQLEAVGPA